MRFLKHVFVYVVTENVILFTGETVETLKEIRKLKSLYEMEIYRSRLIYESNEATPPGKFI